MPELVYKFSESALPVGHFKEDLPGYSPSLFAKRRKNATAYLMVKRVGSKFPITFFLWCDADGKPVDKTYIQLAEGLVIRDLKRDLMAMYNHQEMAVVIDYNEEMKVAKDRLALRQCELKGVAYELPADQEEGVGRQPWFCNETDAELN